VCSLADPVNETAPRDDDVMQLDEGGFVGAVNDDGGWGGWDDSAAWGGSLIDD
jgi:hypothetical protein